MKVSITLAENEGFFYNPSSFKNQEDLIVFPNKPSLNFSTKKWMRDVPAELCQPMEAELVDSWILMCIKHWNHLMENKKILKNLKKFQNWMKNQ